MELSKEIQKFEQNLTNRLDTLVALMGDEQFARRFIKVVLNYTYQNPKIFECVPASIYASIYDIASLRLDIGNGQAFLIPYGNICKPFIGYQGYLTMFYRTGLFKIIYSNLIYEGDHFEIQYGSESKLIHAPKYKSKSVVGGYAYAKMLNGGELFEFLPIEELERRRKLSKVPSSFAWTEFRDEMYRKTCIRALSKWMPKYESDPEILKATILDDASLYGALKLDRKNERFIIDYEKMKKEQLIEQAEQVIQANSSEIQATTNNIQANSSEIQATTNNQTNETKAKRKKRASDNLIETIFGDKQ